MSRLTSNDAVCEQIDDALAELMDMDEAALTALLQSEDPDRADLSEPVLVPD